MEICAVRKKNIGKSKCFKLPTLPKCIITTPNNFKLEPADYATTAALKTAIQNALVAPINSRSYLWPLFSSVEILSEEAQYEDGPLGMIPTRDGQYRFKAGIHSNMCTHKAMFTHRAVNDGRCFVIDVDNQLWATEDADGNLYGFSLALLHTEKFQLSDGASTSTKSPVYVCLSDNEEFDRDGALLDMGTIINQIERLTDVDLTVAGAFAAAAFSVDVKQACDEVPVSGLLLADFILYAADGVATQVIQTVAEDANIPGRYLITAPGANPFEDGSLTLRAPAALTVKAYENPVALAVNVP